MKIKDNNLCKTFIHFLNYLFFVNTLFFVCHNMDPLNLPFINFDFKLRIKIKVVKVKYKNLFKYYLLKNSLGIEKPLKKHLIFQYN